MRARALALLTVIVTLAACSGGAARHASPPTTVPVSTPSAPVVLNDVSGHLALLVTKTGDYSLKSPITPEYFAFSPEVLLSGDVCRYLTGRVMALTNKPITLPGGDRRAILTAELRVTTLKRPLVLAYDITYVRLGPAFASIDANTPNSGRLACITG
jgi:hypothetical protein